MLILGFLVIGLAAIIHSSEDVSTKIICIDHFNHLKVSANIERDTCEIVQTIRSLEESIVLVLSSLYISTIEEKAFKDFTSLQGIFLMNNTLTNTRFLVDLPDSIWKVNMSGNSIEEITSGDFVKFPHFWFLDLAFNDIRELTANTFTNFKSLTVLDVSYNRITKIEPAFFKGIPNTSVLSLQHNELSSLEKDVFAGLVDPMHIDLTYNKFTIIHKLEIFGGKLPLSLRTLSAHHNPLDSALATRDSIEYPCVEYYSKAEITTCVLEGCVGDYLENCYYTKLEW